MNRLLVVLTLFALFTGMTSANSTEQKQYLQIMKENEIKEQQNKKPFREGEFRDGLMDRVYGNRNPVIEYKPEYTEEQARELLERNHW